mgnify:FL=1
MTRRTFESWMAKVDQHVSRRAGVSVHDLTDCYFADWYEDGLTPSRAASRAIRADGGLGDDD